MNRHFTAIMFIVIAVSAMTGPSPAIVLGGASPTWNYQTVATGGSFGNICMVLDSNDIPHIIFNGANGLMFYDVWKNSNWENQGVIQGGEPISLVLDSKNIPHILFKGENDVTYYAILTGTIWKYQAAPTGNRYSIALDKQGNPHIAYGTQLLVRDYPQGITNNYYALNYASWNGESWDTKIVQSQISSSDTISLALDSNGNPTIMYGTDTYYPTSGGYTINVNIATWTGSNWNIQTGPYNLDSIGKMVLDSHNNPHFSYQRNFPHESFGNVSLGYASFNGATWSMQTVASNIYLPGLSLQLNLVLDSYDNPHIEFFNGSLMYASWTGKDWNLDTVAPDQFAYGAGPLALNSKGSPSICYWVDDIRNKTAFVSQLLYTTPTPVLKPSQTANPIPNKTTSPVASVSQKWIFTPAYSIVSSPVFSNGLLYITSGTSGGGTLALYCIDPSTGTQIWNRTTLFASFSVSAGYVFLSGADYALGSLKGAFSCLDARTGKQLWNFSGGTSFGYPLVSDGVVYVSGNLYSLSSGVNAGSIFAFNASTGDKLWSFQGQPDTDFRSQQFALQETTLFAVSTAYSSRDASYHSAVYAINTKDGQLTWNYTTAGLFSSFVATNQELFVTSNSADTRNYIDAEASGGYVYNGGILALNTQDGIPIWSYSTDSSFGVPIIAGNIVYVTSGDGVLLAFNTGDGKNVWNYTAGKGLGTILSVDAYLYVGSSFGVYCFNALDGTVIWNFITNDFAGSSPTNPTYADGVIYVGWNGPMFFAPSTIHNFFGLRASNGEKLWNFSLPYTISSAPLFENGIVLIGGNFVTKRNPDFENSGAIVALRPSITLLPLGSPSVNTPTPTTGSSVPPSFSVSELLVVLIIFLIVLFSLLLYLRHIKNPKSD